MKSIFKATTLLIAILLSYGCDNGETVVLSDINETKALEVRELIASELRVGSTSEEIEAFFNKHEIDFSYDRFSERYQGIIRNVSDNKEVDQAVTIYIYVDKQKQFKSSEVNDSFTAI